MPIGDSVVTAKKKAPAAPAKAGAKRGVNAVEYNVKGECPGIQRLNGVIESIKGGVVHLKHKKRQSSKFALTLIDFKKIVCIQGDFKEGNDVQISFQSSNAIFAMFPRAMYEGFDDKTGMVKGTDKEGKTFYIRPDVCSAVSTSEVDAPPIAIAKKY